MKNLMKYVILVLTIFSTNHANSVSVFPDVPGINFSSPTTEDFIVADISGYYSTPGFVLNGSPVVDISSGNIDIIFDVSSPSGVQVPVIDYFDYFVDVGQLSAGDWYLTPIFYVDGVFDNAVYSVLPLFTVSEVPVPAAAWLFGSGLIGLIGVARRKAGV